MVSGVECVCENLCYNKSVPCYMAPPDTAEREVSTAAVDWTDPIDSMTESDGEWCGVCICVRL